MIVLDILQQMYLDNFPTASGLLDVIFHIFSCLEVPEGQHDALS